MPNAIIYLYYFWELDKFIEFSCDIYYQPINEADKGGNEATKRWEDMAVLLKHIMVLYIFKHCNTFIENMDLGCSQSSRGCED